MEPICCQRERGGCGKLFTPVRKFQKACEPRCASSMIKVMQEDLRYQRRMAAQLQRGEPLPSVERKKKRRRARRLKTRH
jgi:hypothetical protein